MTKDDILKLSQRAVVEKFVSASPFRGPFDGFGRNVDFILSLHQKTRQLDVRETILRFGFNRADEPFDL
jgi:hypothetical protein